MHDVLCLRIQAVVDVARAHVTVAELGGLVMGDPGTGDYIAAYARVLATGMDALLDTDDNDRPLFATFDITESLVQAHINPKTTAQRWFSVLAAAIELLGVGDGRDGRFPAAWGALLTQRFALNDAALSNATTNLCVAWAQTAADARQRALAHVGVLLVATDAEVRMQACQALHDAHAHFHEWYLQEWEPNPDFPEGAPGGKEFAAHPAFIWGAVLDKAELPTWLVLVETHAAVMPRLVGDTISRLVGDGRAWLLANHKTHKKKLRV